MTKTTKFPDIDFTLVAGYNNMDYSCMEALQGCAISELISLEGVLWRTKYERCLSGRKSAVVRGTAEDCIAFREDGINAVMQVPEAIFGEEGQKAVAAGNAVLTYNKNVDFQMNEVFSRVMDCISSNHMYMRLASKEMFAVSGNVVQKMIRREYDAQAASSVINTLHRQREPIRDLYTKPLQLDSIIQIW